MDQFTYKLWWASPMKKIPPFFKHKLSRVIDRWVSLYLRSNVLDRNLTILFPHGISFSRRVPDPGVASWYTLRAPPSKILSYNFFINMGYRVWD